MMHKQATTSPEPGTDGSSSHSPEARSLDAAPASTHLRGPWLPALGFLVGLYGLGVFHWVAFFNYGRLSFQAEDWSKEYRYYRVLQEALQTHTLPWHVELIFHGTSRFLGLPETNLSPQVLLLPWFEASPGGVGRFLVFHVLLLYSAGYIGLLLLRRRYRLGWAPFACLYLLLEMSGHITSHLSVGHSMWCGYFLLPFFVLYVLEMTERPDSLQPALKLALLLFVMNLQGSFHMVIWCWMFLLLLLLFEPGHRRQVAAAVGLSFLLSLFRIVPAAVAFWDFHDYTFMTGYRSLTDVLDAFITLRDPTYPHTGVVLLNGLDGEEHQLRWWEFDLYTGLLGLAFLLYFGIYRRFDRAPYLKSCRYAALDMPLAVQAILSMSCFYAVIGKLPLPLFNAERVSSRFLLIPVVLLTAIAAIRMQRTLEQVRPGPRMQMFLGAGVLQILFTLANHSYVWRVAEVQARSQRIGSLDVRMVQKTDPLYQLSFWVGLGASVLAGVVWLWLWARTRRRA